MAASFHMTADEFRRRGHELVEWVASYLESVESHPVRPSIEPGDIRARLPAHPPATPDSWDEIIADLDRIVLPGTTHWQSPNWFAYFPANASGPSILGDLVSSGLGMQGMLWATGPVCTELETHVLDWLIELLGLPERFLSSGEGGGVIQHSASDATLVAILAARERALGAGDGIVAALRAYTSTEAHSSVEKGVRIAGLGSEQLRLVEVDDEFAMRPDRLEAAIEADVAAGLRPFVVVATVGTTSALAADPVRRIGEICTRHGLWLHVDAAMAGAAGVVPELRWVHEGVELADSWCFDPHKWLFTNFDCDVMYVADRSPLLAALSVTPEYLRNAASASGAVIDYRDWHVPLGRRFRALKLWFVLRHYGADGLRHHIAAHVALAEELAARIDAHPSLERMAPTRLSLVCFAHCDGDDATQAVLAGINEGGRFAVTHTRLSGRLTVRVSIGSTATEARHVDALWDRIAELAGPAG